MKEKYEIIELQFYKDLSESQKELEEEKRIVEEIMNTNSVEYTLELVENQKRSYYEEVYTKGYTLNLIIKKADLHYVLKLLDQNKIGFFASQEEKQAAIDENDIYIEDEDVVIEENNIKSQEEIERQNEAGDAFTRIFFTIIFLIILSVEIFFAYCLYCNQVYNYLYTLIIFVVLQVLFFIYFLNSFKRKIERL